MFGGIYFGSYPFGSFYGLGSAQAIPQFTVLASSVAVVTLVGTT